MYRRAQQSWSFSVRSKSTALIGDGFRCAGRPTCVRTHESVVAGEAPSDNSGAGVYGFLSAVLAHNCDRPRGGTVFTHSFQK